MNRKKDKLLIIHPGTQHASHLANAACMSGLFSDVHLYTGLILPVGSPPNITRFLRSRERQLAAGVKVHNLYVFACVHLAFRRFQSLLGVSGNNADYFSQVIFGCLLLPTVFLNRKNCFLVLFETCGWPMARFARLWGITVIMDFPSMSHEHANNTGIKETKLGIYIKRSERKFADYAFFCSAKAGVTYHGLLHTTESFVNYPGHDSMSRLSDHGQPALRPLTMAFIGNTSVRKGLDIVLRAYSQLTIARRLLIIGAVHRGWIHNFCRENSINTTGIVLTGKLSRAALYRLLVNERISIHLLPSRFDSFAAVVPETMSAGIVNIISQQVGAAELLTDKVNMLLMKSGSVSALLEQINQYIGLSNEARHRLRRNVIKKAAEMTWAVYYLSVEKALNRIITRCRHSNQPYTPEVFRTAPDEIAGSRLSHVHRR